MYERILKKHCHFGVVELELVNVFFMYMISLFIGYSQTVCIEFVGYKTDQSMRNGFSGRVAPAFTVSTTYRACFYYPSEYRHHPNFALQP